MKQFDVIVENRVGVLAELCDVLARSAINIKAIATDAKDGFGVVKLVTEDEATTKDVLTRAKYRWAATDILSIRLPDRPGELAKATKLLARAKVNIESIFLLGSDGEYKDIALKVSDLGRAREVLR